MKRNPLRRRLRRALRRLGRTTLLSLVVLSVLSASLPAGLLPAWLPVAAPKPADAETLASPRFVSAALMPSGHVGLVFENTTASGGEVRFMRYTDEHALGSSLLLASASPWYPQLAVLGSTLVAAFVDTRSPNAGKLVLRTSTDSGANWSADAFPFGSETFSIENFAPRLVASRSGTTLYIFTAINGQRPKYRYTTDLVTWTAPVDAGDTTMRVTSANNCGSAGAECYRAHAFGFMETATAGTWVYITKSDSGFGQSGRGTQVGTLGGAWSTQVDHGGSGGLSGGGDSTATTFLDRDGNVDFIRGREYGDNVYAKMSTNGGTTWVDLPYAYAPNLANYVTSAPVGLYVPGYTLGEYLWYAGFGGSEDSLRVLPLWSAGQAYPRTGTARLVGSGGSDIDAASVFAYNFADQQRLIGAGGYTTSHTDVALSGRLLPLSFARSYNAADDGRAGPLGPGWAHSFEWSITENGTIATLRRGSGATDRFNRNPDGTYASPVGVTDILVKHADGTFTLTTREQLQFEIGAPSQAYRTLVLGAGPTGYWRLGERSGTTAADAGPNSLSGTYSGGSALGMTGAVGADPDSAVYFDGSSGSVAVTTGTAALPAGAHARTLEAWVKTTSSARETPVSYGSTSTRQSFSMVLNDGGAGRVGYWTYADDFSVSAPAVTDGAWHHVALVYDGSVTMDIYLDGTKIGSHALGAALNTVVSASGFVIGRDYYGQAYNFAGTIDEVAIYSSALSAARIAAHYRPASSWTYAYDGATRHLAQVTDPDGRAVVTNTYDSLGRLATQKDGLNKQTAFSYGSGTVTITDPRLHQTVQSYDARSRVISVQDVVGANTYTARYTYDDCGDRSSATDRNGNRTDYTFDTSCRGNLFTLQEPQLDPSTPRFTTTWTYDAKNNPTLRTDAKGFTTSWTYDSTSNARLSETRQIDATTSATTKWIYGDSANPGLATRVVAPRGNTTGTPDNTYSTVFAYDSTGNLTSSTDADGNQTTYAYDSLGRRTSMVDPDGNATGGTPSEHTWSTAYDVLDRVTSATDPLSHSSSATYDGAGHTTTATDKNGNVTTYTYDLAGRLATVKQKPDPVGAPTTVYTTTITRDDNGNATSVTQANGAVTDYSYDDLNRLSSMTTHPATGVTLVTSYTLDGDGNVTNRHTADGVDTSYTFDNLSRLTQIAATGLATISYAYDELSRRTSMADGTGTTTYSHDRMGRLVQAAQPNGTTSYAYDLDSNRTALTYPGSSSVAYSFSNAGRLSSLTDWASRQTSYTYSPAGLAKTVTLPNTMVTTYSYDRAQRLTNLTNVISGTTITSHAYTLDNEGNRTALSEFVSGITTGASDSFGMTYDGLERLTAVTTTNAESFTLDAASNITARTGPTKSFSIDGSNRPTSDGTNTLTWSAADRLTGRGSDSFGFDPLDRLTSSTVAGTARTYAYSGDGLLQSRTTGGSTVSLLWDPATSPSRLLVSASDTIVYGLGPLYSVNGTTVTTYARDGQKSIRAELNGTSVTSSWRYRAYGETAQSSGASNPSILGYAGQLLEPSGLYYMRARWYDAASGRFISRDPLGGDAGSPASINAFGYALARPLMAADPTGLSTMMSDDTSGACDARCDRPQPAPDLKRGFILTSGGATVVGPTVHIFVPVVSGPWILLAEAEDPGDEPESTGVAAGEGVLTPEEVLADPGLLAGRAPGSVRGGPDWKEETLGRGTHEGQGWVLREYRSNDRPTGRLIRWHPGDGHHGPGSYWRVSSGEGGKSDKIPGAR